MSKNLLYETKTVLAELGELRKSVQNHSMKLAKYEAYRLSDSSRKGSDKSQYYIRKKGTKKRKYVGAESIGIVDLVRENRYCNELLKVINDDIRLLEELDKNFVIPEHDMINSKLPKIYKCAKPPAFAPASEAAIEWKRRMEAEKAKHEPYMPEKLTFMASDGTKMRSLSEVIIANYLLSLGITFVYELPMIRNGKKKWPDFTILSPVDNKTVIIIEHQGAMDSETYQVKYMNTLLFYLSTDLVPNKDVFFTFNHLDKHLDTRQIDSILHIAFGTCEPRKSAS